MILPDQVLPLKLLVPLDWQVTSVPQFSFNVANHSTKKSENLAKSKSLSVFDRLCHFDSGGIQEWCQSRNRTERKRIRIETASEPQVGKFSSGSHGQDPATQLQGSRAFCNAYSRASLWRSRSS